MIYLPLARKQSVLFIRLTLDIADRIALRGDRRLDARNIHAVLGDDFRPALCVEGRDLSHALHAAHYIVDVRFAHSAAHPLDFQCDFEHTPSFCRFFAESAAGGKSVVVRRVIADESVLDHHAACGFHSLLPGAHPFAVAPIVGAEQSHLFAR